MGLLHSAKKRGYVTNDQIDALLSLAEVKSEQIEDILAKFSEMGVHVVETERELEVEVAAQSCAKTMSWALTRCSLFMLAASEHPIRPVGVIEQAKAGSDHIET